MRTIVLLASLLGGAAAADPMPRQEHAELLALLGPISDCQGVFSQHGMKVTFSGVIREEAELEGGWIHEAFAGTAGKLAVSFDAHLAYDAKAKQWTRLEAASSGGYAVAHAGPLAGGKLEWESDATLPGGKTVKAKNHLDASDPHQAKVISEVSLDGGKAFVKVVEMTCKKR